MAVSIGPLESSDDRAAFACEEPALTQWFHNQAGQEQSKKVTQVFVARDQNLGVVGFYSLSAFSILNSDLPRELTRRLPRYDTVPAALIGRLARDIRVKGQGIGEQLLVSALRRIVASSAQLGIYAVVVDAKHAKAAAFYGEFGFQSFVTRPLRLFLPIDTARRSL